MLRDSRRSYRALALACVFASLVAQAGGSGGALAQVSYVSAAWDGFDACLSTSTFLTPNDTGWLWDNVYPFGVIYAYIGGEDDPCATQTFNGSSGAWIEEAEYGSGWGRPWGFVLLWYGLQCAQLQYYSTQAAYNAGVADASSAVGTAAGQFVGTGAPMALDIEAYSYNGCTSSIDSYVDGWDAGMDNQGYLPVVYGSSEGSQPLSWLSDGFRPNSVWLVGNTCSGETLQQYLDRACAGLDSVWNLPGIPAGDWSFDQRYAQYDLSVSISGLPSGGSFSPNVDCANGPVALTGFVEGTESSEGGSSDPVEDGGCVND
ncbi:MAG: glycoside hydrolase domain-containing protein [Mycobacteriales bacterium]